VFEAPVASPKVGEAVELLQVATWCLQDGKSEKKH
jgi:hypothetical protein